MAAGIPASFICIVMTQLVTALLRLSEPVGGNSGWDLQAVIRDFTPWEASDGCLYTKLTNVEYESG